jgi:hypothetical protein
MIVGMLLSALYFGLLPLGEFVPLASQTTYIMSTYALGVLGNTLLLCNAIPVLTLISPPQLAQPRLSTQVAL